ncbi:histone-lysine N-methyltransferase 2C isoform X5 [Halyomorpha halys]|uniref:histone-lysine N-methyltransferase 2C isoform X5 n=1 Tax=Halyomorpha halys TaxID=286706 RepID=UPI0006D4CD98|nr:histone-lysine N-methyltransferase 2C-like isoform X5 [Halyomorpha halys]
MEEGSGDREGKSGGGEEDMDVGDCSEEEEDEEEDLEMGSSPIQQEQSSIMDITSPASQPYEGLASTLRMVPPTVLSAGKPLQGTSGLKRGPGRPRSRGAGGNSAPTPRPIKKPAVGLKLKRWKGYANSRLLVSGVYGAAGGKGGGEGDPEGESTSPSQPSTPVDQLKGPIFVDEPLFDEQWPGKLCVLCNLSEHSQLGQGKMMRAECSLEELPRDLPRESLMSPPETPPPIDSFSPRPPLQNRRQKGFAKFRKSVSSGQEPVEELSLVGHIDIPEPSNLIDSGYIYVHEWCAVWCPGVRRDENGQLLGLVVAVAAAATRRCYHCSRYGAGPPCIVPSCNKHFHIPCAAAASAFQHVRTLTLICSQHLDHVPNSSSMSNVACPSCNCLGNVANLVMCSVCGNHHHGACIGNALHPGLRAGWQCIDCRVCQLCRENEETGRMLVCDYCDKAYHPHCVRPAMSSVPKVGWKCKRCRLCSDCGARTPGGGLSSRWHSNYTVCDSCYQQRNKGFSCPVCHKAYRAAALREMVKCSQCRRFVHGTCDKEADFVSYHRKKEAHPDYQYICLSCKNNSTILYLKRKDSTEDVNMDSALNISQESLATPEEIDVDSERSDDPPFRPSGVGLGKGKPFYASKIAKKKLGLGPGRPKGSGKMSSIALSHFQKRPRYADFGRKRGAKTKMRGIFGVPGLGLQRPLMDSNTKPEDEPGLENKLVLVSSRDKYVLSQDVCVMCGALGQDQEACLIACAQCGQSYHPYCVSVKVTKVMLQRGWRCLDCTVCEGCGQRNDEGRLILCDDCDISYHIYCMDPPLGSVPTGVWKCKWCAHCQTCGSNNPGPNSTWQSNFTQCGPCASRTVCPACLELYTDGDLIIKCIHCDRWLHCLCDTISNENEAEACCAQGYTCILCRPNNAALVLPATTPSRAPSPEINTESKATDYYVDGVCLSETGLQLIKTLSMDNGNQPVRRKRPGFRRHDPSVDLVDDMENEEKNAVYKDGMIWGSKEKGPIPSPPEGFTLYTRECGVVVLKRIKKRNLQRLGIGGFTTVKMRSSRFKEDDEHLYPEEKPRRKPRVPKKKSKIAESYPRHLQEAFFGKELLDTTKETSQELESTGDESDEGKLRVVEEESSNQENVSDKRREVTNSSSSAKITIKEEEGSDGETLKDILHLPENLLHNDLVNTIMNESADSIKSENLMSESGHEGSGSQKDELCDILGPHFNIESMVRETGLPNMDSKDVEEIFKGVLTDEGRNQGHHNQASPQQQHPVAKSTPAGLASSPLQYPSASPYNSEYSNSPQFSPESSWDDCGSYNRTTSLKMEADESLGRDATISPVLYANINHPEWKKEYPSWNERFKQILKKWRALPSEEKAPYLQRARDNRTNFRSRKQEHDKTLSTKSCREAEQERQWKELQALRQQQQHMLSQTRVQQVNRVRQVGNAGLVQFSTNEQPPSPHLTQQLQVSTSSQEANLGGLGSPRAQFASGTGGTVKVATPGGTIYRQVRPPQSPFPSPRQPSTPQQQEEVRQLRDLLQRHQVKQEGTETVLSGGVLQGVQMRPQPPRSSLHPQVVHGMEPRVRLVVQQQASRFPGTPQVRLAAPRAQLPDQFLIQRQFAAAAAAQHAHNASAIIRNSSTLVEQTRLQTLPVDQRIQTGGREGEEIPESVTAELEKLEEEGGTIGGEADEVSAIFSDLVEDDDELLAEMGSDFNILEYADPELDTVSGGEKTNILDDLEDEVEKKKQVGNSRKDNSARRTSSESINKELTEPRPESKPSEEVNRVSVTSTPPHLPQQISLSGNSGISQPKIVGSGYQTQFATPSTPLPRMQVLQGANQVNRGGASFVGNPPPPPPPYPGPPPPYPGQQAAIRGRGVRSHIIPGQASQAQQRRTLLLQEQPLLLEELLEEEKREQEKASVTPSPASSLMSDADFEMLRADVLGSRNTSPPQSQSLGTLNLVGPPPPPPPENIVTEADRQAQVQYETWLRTTGSAVSQQIRYFETEVQKLRKIRKSLNSKQRQLRKNGNELNEKDAIELQRVTGEQTTLQKHLEAARKQSRQHTMVMQEYQTKQESKGGGGSVGSASPQSPLLSPAGGGVGGHQSHQPSPQTSSVSPVRHSPAGTPHSQSGDDKSESGGLPSPRPPPMTPTPPSPHQFHQIRHPSMVSRFARSPEGGLRPRLAPLQTSGFNSPRGMSPQPPSPQTMRLTQQQQLLLQRHQLQQQKQQILEQHPEAGAILSRQLLRQEPQRQFRTFPGPQSPGSQGGSPLYSPRAPPSPMVYQGLQTPTSPMPQFTQPTSPMQSPRLQYAPSSPHQQQYRPNSPMVPSPMRRPSSASPQGEGGGGNPFNPNNPIPIPPELCRLKLGLKGGSPMWSDKRKRVQPGTSSEKVASLVCVDYNDFEEESPPITPPSKPALIKKTETVKARQSEDTDSELTVYDDIVLVEGCKETNLEVAELRSALEGNVMSTVVSMPMVIDSGQIQMMDVEGELLDDLVVLGVGNGTTDSDCILEVNKDLILDDDVKEDELDDGSPPRARMQGKVLPGGGSHNSPSPESRNNCDIFKKVEEKSKKLEKERKSTDERTVPVQPNIVVSRTPTTFTPVVTQKSIPIADNRQLTIQQATVASLVQDAVNAAKMATEAQNLLKSSQANEQHRNAISRGSFVPLSVITSKAVENESLVNNSIKTDIRKSELSRFSDVDNGQKEMPENKQEQLKFRLENASDIRIINTDSSIIKYKTSESVDRHLVHNEINVIKENEEVNDKRDHKIVERINHITPKVENVTLPCVSSSILEAQLTSMLRTSSEQPSNQNFIYAVVNHTVKDQRREENNQDDMRVEGLAAHFQRTVKNEELMLSESDIYKNSRNPHLNKKHGNIYVSSQIKTDTVMVGGKSYKIYQAGPQSSTSDILTLRDDKEEANGRVAHKVNTIERRLSISNEKATNEMLQQRVVSSSETGEKETHHMSFGGPKAQVVAQKEEPKKFVALATMLLPRNNEEKRVRPGEDSQNVLLKQLLQNTACATTTTASLPIVPSLEAQLARPVPPTPSSLLPSVLNEPPKEIPQSKPQQQIIESPKQESRPHIGPSSLDELLSPPPPPQQLQHPPSAIQTSPIIKREPVFSLSQPGPVMTPMVDVKREVEVKKEVMSSDEMLSPGLRLDQADSQPQDIKKLKKRPYHHQKRRQSLGKEMIGGTPKKRPRKSSKVEEDYDSFIDSVMHQLRQTPGMSICEPNLTYNFTGCPPFGAGDMSKVNSCTRLGELRGIYGSAYLPHENDHYNTLPFGDLPPKAPSTPATQRGFYNEEFAPLKLHTAKDDFDDRKYDYNRDRDNDTPDTIISSSSPECIMPEFHPRFPGLQLIDSDNEEERFRLSRFSPDIPIIAPLAIRPKPIRFYSDMDKENETPDGERGRIRESVTVTLTLTSQAADDVLSVLRNLANVLRIPVPATHSITERSSASHRLGIYRLKGKDGKEGAQVDIQSILNGTAKFCRHCDVVIMNNLMRKKASEMPLVARQGEEDLYFCSTSCYMQLALSHPQGANKDKALTIIDHQQETPSKKTKVESTTDCSAIKIEPKKEFKLSSDPTYMTTRGSGKREKQMSGYDKTAVTNSYSSHTLGKKSPSRYRTWTSATIPPPSARHKKPTDKEITEMLFKSGITVMPLKLPEDSRHCLLCHQVGDGVTDGPARLLNYDVNKWIHLNCALWSDEVYETVNGGLMNVEIALQNGLSVSCAYCNTTGATLKCYKMRCSLVYHLPCAVKDQCVFFKNKTLFCSSHVPKNEKENELTTLSVMRRVYISRDENRQVAAIMHHSEQTSLLRVGSLIFLSVGQLLPHQLQAFHTPNYIYPVGYKIIRMYWSMRTVNKRCRYICSIGDVDNKPEFRITVEERGEADMELRDNTPRGVWLKVLEPLAELRKVSSVVQLFSRYVTGEDLFGLTEPAIVRVLESLPGVETLSDYKFKYGRNPLLELPLAVNPTGCARSEGKPKGWKRAHTQRATSLRGGSSGPAFAPSAPLPGELACPYSKQFVHSKSSQYKKMKQEWRNNVFLARSKIQGLGLYAARDLERHTMVIEYIGEIIRSELAETREKQYEAKNRGIYMFRLDEDRVVDATLCGGLARYINHSCSPNCVAETVEVDRDLRIIIFTKRRISRGEELAYDYKFDIEDDQHKIPCMCGAPNCRKWMN